MIHIMKKNKFVGGRILKTGIAVLLTSLICYWLNWPAMFAVITAIVTIEPTAKDSIKKAFVRFPASAIGTAYAVLFVFCFGDSPLSYTFVALGTIYTCHKLGLHAGILVATLTGVAMISTVHHEYFSSFFVRLGTTSIGLIVSSLVNFLVIRPDYSSEIGAKTRQLVQDVGQFIEQRGMEIAHQQPLHKGTRATFATLEKHLEQIDMLCSYQKKEWSYHRSSRAGVRAFHYAHKKITVLHQLVYHLGNLKAFPVLQSPLDDEKQRILCDTACYMKRFIHGENCEQPDFDRPFGEELLHQLRQAQEEQRADQSAYSHLLSQETSLFYELISILDLLEELKHIKQLEQRHSHSGDEEQSAAD